jgi:hypothetical protein
LTLEFLPPLACYPISTNTFFEELLVLLRMPYRIVPAERVVTFASHPKHALPVAITPKYNIQINAVRCLLPLQRYRFPLRIFETNRKICSTDRKLRFPENRHFSEYPPTLNN